MASGRGRSTFEPLTGFLAQAVGLLARPDPLIILSNALAGVLQCNAGDMEGKGQRDLRHPDCKLGASQWKQCSLNTQKWV